MGSAIEKQPVSVWIANNQPKGEMFYAGACGTQFAFIAKLQSILFGNPKTAERCTAIIGTHRSKSINLPVVEFQLPNVRLVMRDNFYDWKVSVQIDEPIDPDVIGVSFFELFDRKAETSSCHCEGFSEHDVFGSFDSDHGKFTVSIGNDENLAKFCTLLRNYAAGIGIRFRNC